MWHDFIADLGMLLYILSPAIRCHRRCLCISAKCAPPPRRFSIMPIRSSSGRFTLMIALAGFYPPSASAPALR